MAVSQLKLTPAWQQVASAKTILMLQSGHDYCEVYLGATEPATTDVGFTVPNKEPHLFPALDSFGGGAWVRGLGGTTNLSAGRVIYATD